MDERITRRQPKKPAGRLETGDRDDGAAGAPAQIG
jgi:hypothetical protein